MSGSTGYNQHFTNGGGSSTGRNQSPLVTPNNIYPPTLPPPLVMVGDNY